MGYGRDGGWHAMRARGFSLIEFVVVIIAVGIVTGFALDRLLPIIGRAERIAFVQVKSELQSALLLEAAERIARGESNTLSTLNASNPMLLLFRPPANYLGAFPTQTAPATEPASWHFDTSNNRLVYRIGRYAAFEALEGPADRIELEVRFAFRDRDGDGQYDPGSDSFDGLGLDSVYAYRWPD